MPHIFTAVIVGAGFSGVGMACKLKQLGIDDFILLDKASEVGGTWWWNKYPGCACDTPSHLYSFSFFPKPDWSRVYSPQPEILEYLKTCAAHYRLYPHIRFDTMVKSTNWDGACWNVTTTDGHEFACKYLLLGVGTLHVPHYPAGSENFKGPVMHTSDWNCDVSLKGKRVAFVGSAASAVQALPEVAKEASEVIIFQRTPSWVAPKPDYTYSWKQLFLFKYIPFARYLYRTFQYWFYEIFVWKIFAPKTKAKRPTLEYALAGFIQAVVKDKSLHAKLTPDYMVGCKRVLLSNNYYPTFNRDNVVLYNSAVEQFTENSVVVGDNQHTVDAVVCATGFQVHGAHSFVKGKTGRTLHEEWNDLPRAHLTVTVPNFPNMFLLNGPGGATGHTSNVLTIELALDYVVKIIRYMECWKYKVVEVKPDVFENSTNRLLAGLEKRVWGIGGCRSWYQNKDGKPYAPWDAPTYDLWWRTRSPKWNDYVFSK